MPRAKKTWADKMQARPPHTVRLDKDFAGVPKGALLLISSPQEVEAQLRAIPPGQTWPVQQLRRELARAHGCDAACPVSTSIFLRTVAEHAWEQLNAGTPAHQVAPFWRVIEPGSPLARKLTVDADFIRTQRELEAQVPA